MVRHAPGRSRDRFHFRMPGGYCWPQPSMADIRACVSSALGTVDEVCGFCDRDFDRAASLDEIVGDVAMAIALGDCPDVCPVDDGPALGAR